MDITGASSLPAQASRIFRVRKTASRMLYKRGYNVPEEDLEMDGHDFRERFGTEPKGDDLTLLVAKPNDPEDKCMVFFPDGDLGIKEIRPLIERMHKAESKRGILVSRGKCTNHAKQALQDVLPHYVVEYFRDDELIVDITDHELVPQHVVLNDEEKKQLLERYRVRETQLPRIQLNDPIARFYGMQRGQVVKIIRPSETAGRYVTYRIVV
eukprot:gb/GECG01012448.1/.p1 GENE.gb/GECG01012448.1/~~gb/GECG01012448.1/.p1  ORF type:complete len:211 (+),score=24.26 gb/GECG01012448.1/:1-633(+)